MPLFNFFERSLILDYIPSMLIGNILPRLMGFCPIKKIQFSICCHYVFVKLFRFNSSQYTPLVLLLKKTGEPTLQTSAPENQQFLAMIQSLQRDFKEATEILTKLMISKTSFPLLWTCPYSYSKK